MKKIKLFVVFSASLLAGMLTACSHNAGGFTVGTRAQIGIDPENMTANISYVDGLNVIDVSRENSEWELEIDSENGVTVDKKTGNIKGIKRIKRKVGPQVTGYLVDLAKQNPELAALYLKAVLEQTNSQNTGTSGK